MRLALSGDTGGDGDGFDPLSEGGAGEIVAFADQREGHRESSLDHSG